MKTSHESAEAPVRWAIREVLGAAAASVLGIFDFVEIADEEVRLAGNPRGIFEHLLPPQEMRDMVPDVYRAHCRELIQRHQRGESLERATDAEVLCAFSSANLGFPLNRNATAAYAILFKRILKDDPAARALDLGEPARLEDYEGAAEELLSKMRRRRVRHVARRRTKNATPEARQSSLAELIDAAG
ncbi:MAG: hypothetical protein QOE90_3045 [Thermoplasmata archaeon]|jgi:hypothetical protein|nr:hypothetical protein [Thermoplasmata archaeon]